MKHPYLSSRLTVLALLFLLGNARAENTLQKELEVLAGDLKKLLASRGNAVAIGTFTGPKALPASAGPAIGKLLSEELAKAKVDVRDAAPFIVQGEYKEALDNKSSRLAVALLVQVVDRSGKELVGVELRPRGVFGDVAIAALLGVTTTLPPAGDAKERDQTLLESIEKPAVEVDEKNRIRAGPMSPFALEFLVKSGTKYVSRKPTVKDGLAFVRIKRDEVYAVRVINDADHEAAVNLTIDGLSMFVFSEARDPSKSTDRVSHLFVGPGKSVLVRGWYRNPEKSDLFLVTEYGKSAAAQLVKGTDGIGTITASFAASWPVDGTPPSDEPKMADKFARSAESPDATGRGATFQQKYRLVKRQIGVVRGAVSVRYNKPAE